VWHTATVRFLSWITRRTKRCAWCGVRLENGSAVTGYSVCSEEHASLYWATIGM
jgi:hypothetical protein